MPKLLVVEDNENLRSLYEQELTDEGYSVSTADSGKEAIACIEDKKPDLIIMDIAMPDMDGIQTMHEILHKHRIIPIILNTAFPNFRDDYATWPANAYVMKSGDLTELKQKIHEQLQLFGVV